MAEVAETHRLTYAEAALTAKRENTATAVTALKAISKSTATSKTALLKKRNDSNSAISIAL